MVTGLDDFTAMQRVEPGPNFKPVERVISTVAAARAIFFKLRTDHLRRIQLYAEIKGMIAGNPPYERDALAKANLSHIANFNTLEPRALYEKAALSYWNLLFSTETIINIVLNVEDAQAVHWGKVISRHWNDVIREGWPSFDINVSVLCANLVQLGISPIVWADELDPRWRVVELSRFFVPDQSASDLDLLSIVCLENEFPITYLMEVVQKYRNNRDGTEWDIDELESFLAWIANSPMKEQYNVTDLVDLQQKITDRDVSYDRLYNETVKLVSLFYKENDGSITHMMFHRDWEQNQKFLFVKESQYKKFEDFLIIFTQSPGEQYIHANKGLGHKMFALSQGKMMLDNSMVDQARWASTPLIKSPSNTIQETAQLRFYPGVPTDLGGSEFVNNTLGANLDMVIGVSRYMGGMLDRNLAFSGDDPTEPDRSTGSLSPVQARLKAFKEFGVLKNQVNHFYRSFDVLLRQMTLKLIHSKKSDPGYDLCREWKERCVDDGVPEVLFEARPDKLPKFWKVGATRVAGAGSQTALITGLEALAPIAGSFDRRGQYNYQEMYITGILGPEYVPALIGDLEDVDEIGGGASLAAVENAIMKEGNPPLFTMSNDHRSHLAVHMLEAQGTIEGIAQGKMDTVQGDRVFTVLVPHVQEHLQALAVNPLAKDEFERYKPLVADLVRYAQLNRRKATQALQAQAEKQAQEQQDQEAFLNEERRKDVALESDIARKNRDSDEKIRRQNEASNLKASVLREKTSADIQTKQAKAQADIAAKERSSAANPPLEGTNARAELSRLTGGITPSPFDFEGV